MIRMNYEINWKMKSVNISFGYAVFSTIQTNMYSRERDKEIYYILLCYKLTIIFAAILAL